MTYEKTYLPTLKTHVVNLKSDAKDLSRDLQQWEVRGKLGCKTRYSRRMRLKEMNSCPFSYLDGQSVVHALRFIFGNSSQLHLTEDCIKASFWIEVMSSLLSHIILEKRVFLISFSWQRLSAVLSVFKVALGAFSCQKRSPILVRLNWFAKMHWNVALSSPPLGSLGSSIPEKRSK